MNNHNFTTAGIKLNIDVKDAFKDVNDVSSLLTKSLKGMEMNADAFSKRWGDLTHGIKDAKRIASGIMISQAFYTLSGAIVSTTTDILEFSSSMENAAISMEYFIKNTDGTVNAMAKSQAYLREINRFAARTPFSTEQTLQLSRYMQAMGMGIETTKSFFGVMADAAAATGGTEEQLNRAVIALGRMQAKGRITSMEIRQLAAANIPIYQILQEELNLTGEQVANLGKEWLDSGKAISAILTGLEKRYEGAADRMADTFSGMTNIIKDNIKIIGQVAGASVFEGLTGGMMTLRNALQEYREVALEQGAGGLFNQLLHDIDSSGELGTRILTIIGSFYQLKDALHQTYISAKPLRDVLGNTLYAGIITVTNGITALSKITSSVITFFDRFGISSYTLGNALASLYITYKVGSWLSFLGQGAIAAGWALVDAAKAASLLLPACLQARAGVAALTAGLAGLIIYGIAAAGVFSSITNSFAGLDTATSGDNILPDNYMKQFREYEAEFEKYNAAINEYKDSFDAPFTDMDDGSSDMYDRVDDNLDKVKKASSKAAKAVKQDWLAAFDEVYAIPKDHDMGASGGGAGGIGDIPLPDFGLGLLAAGFKFPKIESIPLEMPKLDLKNAFQDSLWDADLVTNNSLKGMIPFLAASLMAALARSYTKMQKERAAKDKAKGTAPGGGGPTSSLGMSEAELAEAIEKLGTTMQKRLGDLENYLERLKQGQLTGEDLDTAIKLLEREIRALNTQLEKLNELNFLAGKGTTHISGALDEATKTLKDMKITQLRGQLRDIHRAIAAGGAAEDIEGLIKQRDIYQRQLDKLMVEMPKSIQDHLAGLSKAYTKLFDGLLDSSTLPEKQLELVQAFNTEVKKVLEIVDAMGGDKALPDYKLLLENVRQISGSSIELEKALNKFTVLADKQFKLRNDKDLLLKSDMTRYADEIIRIDLQIKENGEKLKVATDQVKQAVMQLKFDEPTARKNVVEEANRREARLEAARLERERLAEEAKAERIRQRNERIARKEAVDAQKRNTTAIEKGTKAVEAIEEATNKNAEALRESIEMYDQAQERMLELESTIKSMEDVFLSDRDTSVSTSALKKLAGDFGIAVEDANKNVVKAFADKIDELKYELGTLREVFAEPDIAAASDNLAEQIVRAYLDISRSGVTDLPAGALPGKIYVEDLPKAIKKLVDSSDSLRNMFAATGTKMLTLSRGIGEYGNSIPEMIANILKDNYADMLPGLTSRNFSPFLKLVSELGVILEEQIILEVGDKLKNIGKLYKGATVSTADNALIVQIDSFIETLAGAIIPTDIKTISGEMRDKLWESGRISIEAIEQYKAEWFYQFAAQVQAMTEGQGGDMGIITFNRDYDFGEQIAKRFNEVFHVGEFGNIFSPDVIMKATNQKTDKAAIENYFRILREEVFTSTLRGTIDMSPIREAIDVGVVNYSKQLLEDMKIMNTAHIWKRYANMIASVIDGNNLENFLKTYVEFDTALGKLTYPVNFANIPRVFTKAETSLNKWLQTILDNPDIKLSGTFKSEGKAIQGLLDNIVETFNETLDTEDLTRKLTVLRKDMIKLFSRAASGLPTAGIENLSEEFGYIVGMLEGTTADYKVLIKALDEIMGTPGTVEHTGRIIRSIIERTNSVNRSILEGMEITSSELFGLRVNIEKLAKVFNMGADEAFQTTLVTINNLMAEIKKTGDAAVLDLATQIKLPFKTLGIEEAFKFAAGEIQEAIKTGAITFADAATSMDAQELFKQAIEGFLTAATADTYPEMKRLTGAFKRLIIDIEATGLDLREALITQVAVKDITPGGTGASHEWYIDRGHEQNKKILEMMQTSQDTTTANYKFYAARINEIKDRITQDGQSIEGILRELVDTPKADPRLLRLVAELTDLSQQTLSETEILTAALDWAALTDVAKEWQNVTVAMLDAGLSIEQVGTELAKLTAGLPTEWVGHNIFMYDLPALKQVFGDIDFTHMFDTLTHIRTALTGEAFRGVPKTLSNMYEILTGVSADMAHNAAADIEMTSQIYKLLDSGFVDKFAEAVTKAYAAGTKLTNDKLTEIAQQVMGKMASTTSELAQAPLQKIIETITADISQTSLDNIGNYLYQTANWIANGISIGTPSQNIEYLGQMAGLPAETVQQLVAMMPRGATAEQIVGIVGQLFPGLGASGGAASENIRVTAEQIASAAAGGMYSPPGFYTKTDWGQSYGQAGGSQSFKNNNWGWTAGAGKGAGEYKNIFERLFSKKNWAFEPTDEFSLWADLMKAGGMDKFGSALEGLGYADGFTGRIGTQYSPGSTHLWGDSAFKVGRYSHIKGASDATSASMGPGGSGFYYESGETLKHINTSIPLKTLAIAGEALRIINAGMQIYDTIETQVDYEMLAKGLEWQDTPIEYGGLLGKLGVTPKGKEVVKTGPGFDSSIIFDNIPQWRQDFNASVVGVPDYYGQIRDPETSLLSETWVDMASITDRILSASTAGLLGTRSGTDTTLTKYFDMGPEDKAYWGAKYISGGATGLSGILGASMGRGVKYALGRKRDYTDVDGNYQIEWGDKIKKDDMEEWIRSQAGTGSQFEAAATHILTSGDTTSKAAKYFYKKYGDHLDVFRETMGMDTEWLEGAQMILDNMGPEINAVLKESGMAPINSLADIDFSMKPFFDSIMNSIHEESQKNIISQLDMDRDHNTGRGLAEDWSRIFESTKLGEIPLSSFDILKDELGITISKVNNELGKISIDSTVLNENLSGWTKRLPEGIDLSAATITSREMSILAQAGIQVNGDGTVTFMKAMNEAMSGAQRDMTLTIDDVSKDVLSKLSDKGVNLSFGEDGATLDLSVEALSGQMQSAMFRLNKDLAGQVSQDMHETLSGLGRVLDSGYFEITNAAVLNGEMTISEYIDSMGVAADKLSPEVRAALETIDDVIAQGGDVTRETIAEWADGIVMPSPIDAAALTPEIEAAFAAIGITFVDHGEELMMVVNKLGDDLSDGMTLIPKELWDELDQDIVDGLKAMGVSITEEGGHVKVDLTNTLGQLVDIDTVTPQILDAFGAMNLTFETEGGKIVGITDKFGNDVTDILFDVTDEIGKTIDPAMIEALENMGIHMTEENDKFYLDFTGLTERGIEDIVALYVDRPDLWDKIPEGVMEVLAEANLVNNEGMLEIKADMLGTLVEIGDDWVGNWNKLAPETQKALGLTMSEADDGLYKIKKVTTDADMAGLLEGTVIKPFSELPKELQDKLTGEGGVTAEISGAQYAIEQTTIDTMNPMINAVKNAFGEAVGEAATGAADITQAVKNAMQEINNLNNVKVKKQSITSKIVGAVTGNTGATAKQNKTTGAWTVTGGGRKYPGIYASTKASAISQARSIARARGLPSFKLGGLIQSDGLYRAGEFGRTEAVLPLEDPSAMRQVGEAIGSRMELPMFQREALLQVGTAVAAAMPRDIAAPLSRAVGIQDAGVHRQSDYKKEVNVTADANAITQRVLEVVLPAMANARGASSGEGDKRPLYVGTLIADERGLKELNRKMEIIDRQEKARRG